MAIEALGEGLPKSYEHPKLKVMGEWTDNSLWLSIVFIQPLNDTQECEEKRKNLNLIISPDLAGFFKNLTLNLMNMFGQGELTST